jgi:uncharacterized protein YaiI (UPF0178 family)
MSASARGCVKEPKFYGPFRLVYSMERMTQLLEERGLADDFLRGEKEKIKEGECLLMKEREEFIKFLDELVVDFTKKLKKS